MKGKLIAVGVGPGDPELLTLKAVKAIRSADVIICPAKGNSPGLAYKIAEEAVPEISFKEILPLCFPMEKNGTEQAHREAAEAIISRLQEGKSAAFLTLGDPGLYSTFSFISGMIAENGFEISVISGVTSFCAAAAKLLLPLAGGSGSVLISSGVFTDFPGTEVIMKAGSCLKTLKEQIRESGKTAYLAENCGMADEKLYSGIDAMPDETGYFSLLIVK